MLPPRLNKVKLHRYLKYVIVSNCNRTILTEVGVIRIKITEPDLQIRNSLCPAWQEFIDTDRTFYSVAENVISEGRNV